MDDAALRAEMTAVKARFNSPTPAQRRVLEMGFKINSKQPEVRAAGMPLCLHSALCPGQHEEMRVTGDLAKQSCRHGAQVVCAMARLLTHFAHSAHVATATLAPTPQSE